MKHIIPVVAACIFQRHPMLPHRTRLLLHIRDESRDPELLEKWEFPGGMMEYGETPEDALCREIREELGIVIQVNRLLYAQTNIYESGEHYLVLFYECQTDCEHAPKGCNWIVPQRIREFDCLPGAYEVVDRLSNEAG